MILDGNVVLRFNISGGSVLAILFGCGGYLVVYPVEVLNESFSSRWFRFAVSSI